MTKPTTYYVSGSAIDQISAEYGGQLDDLTVIEKLHLLSILSLFLSAIAEDDEFYTLPAAEMDFPFQTTSDVQRVVELLQTEVSEALVKGFMLALSNQVYETRSIGKVAV